MEAKVQLALGEFGAARAAVRKLRGVEVPEPRGGARDWLARDLERAIQLAEDEWQRGLEELPDRRPRASPLPAASAAEPAQAAAPAVAPVDGAAAPAAEGQQCGPIRAALIGFLRSVLAWLEEGAGVDGGNGQQHAGGGGGGGGVCQAAGAAAGAAAWGGARTAARKVPAASRALDAAERGLHISPLSDDLLKLRSRALMALGRHTESADAFRVLLDTRQMLRQAPNVDGVRISVAHAEGLAGNLPAALAALQGLGVPEGAMVLRLLRAGRQ